MGYMICSLVATATIRGRGGGIRRVVPRLCRARNGGRSAGLGRATAPRQSQPTARTHGAATARRCRRCPIQCPQRATALQEGQRCSVRDRFMGEWSDACGMSIWLFTISLSRYARVSKSAMMSSESFARDAADDDEED